MSLKSQSFKIKTPGYTGTKIIEKLYFYSFSPFAFRFSLIAYSLSPFSLKMADRRYRPVYSSEE